MNTMMAEEFEKESSCPRFAMGAKAPRDLMGGLILVLPPMHTNHRLQQSVALYEIEQLRAT